MFIRICSLCLSLCSLVVMAQGAERKPIIGIGKIKWSVTISNNAKLIADEAQADKILSALRTQVATALVRTKKFDVVDRDQFDQVVEEIKLIHESGLVDPNLQNTAKFGSLEGVNWMVMGSLTQFSETGSGSSVGGWHFSSRGLLLVLDLRIVDIESGRVVDAAPLEVMVNVGRNFAMGYSARKSESEKLNELMRITCDKFVHCVVENVCPIKIIAISGSEAILSYGSGLLNDGDLLSVFTRGQMIRDPDTGKEESEWIAAGTIEVFQARGAFAKAKPKKGTKWGSLKVGDICTIVDTSQSAKSSRR